MAGRMDAWRNLRYGLFLHWGPYSDLGGQWNGEAIRGNTEWIMRTAAIPRAEYREAAGKWAPDAFDANAMVSFARRNGFKYLIVTAKHYDGFALFDSRVSDFDAPDVLASKRDLLKEIATACQKADLPLGYSYALDRDWYHPGGNTLGPAWDPSQAGAREEYLQKVALPQIRELSSRYGPVFALHADPGQGLPEWLAPEFSKAVDAKTVLAKDFEGGGDYTFTDGSLLENSLSALDWEKCRTLGDSWGYRNANVKWQTPAAILRELVTTVSRGGNYLLNVGLDGQGNVPDGAKSILEETGAWLAKHGESIHGTSRSPYLVHPWDGVATLKEDGEKGCTLYLHAFSPAAGKISLGPLLTQPESAEVLGSGRKLVIEGTSGRWMLDPGPAAAGGDGITVVRVKLPSWPELGPGPIAPDAAGEYHLDLARGRYADTRTVFGRTPSSASLQLTGFRDERDAATWDLHSDAPSEVSLRMIVAAGPDLEGKRLLVKVNGREVAVATFEKIGTASTASPERHLASPSFRLPGGAATISISGAAGEDAPVPLTTSRIELIPSH